MTGAAMFVLAEAEAGRLAELADWYVEHHIPEMLAVPGIASAAQYQPVQGGADQPPATLLTIYRFDTDDADGVIAELTARRPQMSSTTALAGATVWIARGTPEDS